MMRFISLFYKTVQNKMSKQIEEERATQISQVPKGNQQTQQYESVLDKIEAPPTNFNLKQNALEYDIKLGWIPRSQITGPIPLSFSSYVNDEVIEKKAKSLIYLGYRAKHSFQLHERYYEKGKKYPFYQFHLCKSQFLDRFFKKYYSDYEFSGCREPQTIGQAAISFNSDFQGGNLDAVYFQEGEYRLLVRVDSNTQGHCNYFNFRVRVGSPGGYTIRIMNINKQKSLYQRGMRPYVRERKGGKWSQYRQCQSKVSFGNSPLCDELDLRIKLKSLHFEYQFTSQVEEYEFSYSIPYSYSNLMQFLNGLRTNPFLHFTKLCHTLSGVEVPLLTIAGKDRQQQESQQKEPYVVVITGRVHPSQTNGSHIINGMITHLLGSSEAAKYLRNNVIFKIIPMLNPDGVIIGNTRTSFAGKDLNRRYYKNTQFVFPEIIGMMDYVSKLKSRYQGKLLFLIDIHGHSGRKNSFFYGPQFSIIDQQYTKCRLLPKVFSQKTDVFRYYSCKFKMVSSKQYTARGYFNNIGVRAYTHETSIHCHWNFDKRKDEPFTRKTLEKLGESLVESISQYVKMQTTVSKHLKQEIEKEIQRPNVRQRGIDFTEDQQDSQEMPSSKQDSESEDEDFQDKKLMQFYNKINQNKEYFIQQLQAMEKDPLEKKDKNKEKEKVNKNEQKNRKKTESFIKNDSNFQQQRMPPQKRQKIQDEIVMKKSLQKVDWAAKAVYPQKKKTYQQYTKMSSVIFGSSIPPSYFMSNQYITSTSNNNSNFGETKYTIKCLDAQFKSTTVKYPSPQPKVYRSKQLKRENSVGQPLTRQKQERQKSVEKVEQKITLHKFMQLTRVGGGDTQAANQRRIISKSEMERLLSRPSQYGVVKPLPVCSVELQMQKKEEQRLIKNLNGSLKVLTRKKSIKSIRESQKKIITRDNKVSKDSLVKKLPSIFNILNMT